MVAKVIADKDGRKRQPYHRLRSIEYLTVFPTFVVAFRRISEIGTGNMEIADVVVRALEHFRMGLKLSAQREREHCR